MLFDTLKRGTGIALLGRSWAAAFWVVATGAHTLILSYSQQNFAMTGSKALRRWGKMAQ
jgi:hypothetical protein